MSLQGFSTFDDVFTAVRDSKVQYGIVPIENSYSGSIPHVFDCLLHFGLFIVAETSTVDDHCLCVLPGSDIRSIKKVISQSEFFSHCSGFLQDLSRANDGTIERVVCWDGAGSPTLVKSLADPTVACIASRHAASLYGLEVIAEAIGNLERQSTRYFIISRSPASEGDLSHSKDVKVSIAVALRNVPNALVKSLSVFSSLDFNITKMESRPATTASNMFSTAVNVFEYVYFLDFECGNRLEDAHMAIAFAKKMCLSVRELGWYPVTLRSGPASPRYPWTAFL